MYMSLYIFVRIAIATICLFIIIRCIINKVSVNKQKTSIIWVVIIVFSLSSFLYLLPFENLFVSFKTPESAVYYYNNWDDIHIVYGQDSCLVISENDSSKKQQILIKDDEGWKIKTGFSIKTIAQQSNNLNYLKIMNVNGSQDTYISIINIFGDNVDIQDKYNTHFKKTEPGHYYGYLSNYSEGYSITINSIEIKF